MCSLSSLTSPMSLQVLYFFVKTHSFSVTQIHTHSILSFKFSFLVFFYHTYLGMVGKIGIAHHDQHIVGPKYLSNKILLA